MLDAPTAARRYRGCARVQPNGVVISFVGASHRKGSPHDEQTYEPFPKNAHGNQKLIFRSFLLLMLALLFSSKGTICTQAMAGPPSELEGVRVKYFPRNADQGLVTNALDAAGIPFIPESSKETRLSNVVTCTPDVDALAVQKVALAVLQGGVQIRAIVPSIHPEKRQFITIETYDGYDDDPVIAAHEIRSLTACPNSTYPERSVHWVAAHDIGSPVSFFFRDTTDGAGAVLEIGTIVRTDRPLNIRETPADWSHVAGVLPKGARILVEEFRWLPVRKTGQRQLWVRVQPPGSGSSPAAELPIAKTRTAPTRDGADSCLRKGYQTVSEMFICSHGLFTPELLSSCLLMGSCELGLPAFAFDGLLSAQGQGWSQPLAVQAPQLNPDKVVSCPANADAASYNDCVAKNVFPQPRGPTAECDAIGLDPDSLGRCIVSKIPSPWNLVADCLMGSARNDPVTCFRPFAPDLAKKISDIDRCISKAGAEVNWQSLLCLLQTLPGEYGQLAMCLEPNIFGDLTRKLQCAALIPFVSRAVQVVRCPSGTKSAPNLLRRCAPALGVELPSGVVSCLRLAENDQVRCLQSFNIPKFECYRRYANDTPALISCLVDGSETLRQTTRIIQCLVNAQDPSDFVAACLPLDEKIRIPASCALRQTDRQGLIACAAAAFLDAEQRRIFACAVASQSYFEFGVCLSGIKMNREIATVVKCVGSSGGNPYAAGVCTVGKWTADELQKCRVGIGTADGCFGPGNTIVQYFGGLNTALLSGPVQPQAILWASIQAATAVTENTGKEINAIKTSLDACAQNPTSCPSQAIDFCTRNPVVCATGIPIRGNPVPPITIPQINIPHILPNVGVGNLGIPSPF
jgi:hypothetical protein